MCTTTILRSRDSLQSCLMHRQHQPVLVGCKRARENPTSTDSAGASRQRHRKRVSFSNRDMVLGRAPSYDRSSAPDPIPLATRIRVQEILESRKIRKLAQAQNTAATTTTHDDSPMAPAPPGAAAGTTKANFCGIWRRSIGFNWAALLELSGVDKAAVPEQVGSGVIGAWCFGLGDVFVSLLKDLESHERDSRGM